MRQLKATLVHIRIVNPNTTEAFTRRLAAEAIGFAAPGTRVDAVNPADGTPSIESHAEEAIGAIGVMDCVREGTAAGVDAFVVACFGDTGVAAAREVTPRPVVGMTEAAVMAAALVAARFAIITLPPRTIPHAERVLRETGLAARATPVRAIALDVLDLEFALAEAEAAFAEAAARAIRDDGAEAIVLGCAGLGPLVEPLRAALGVPVIDGVAVGVKFAEALVATGLSTSRIGAFGPPPWKGLTGRFAGMR